MSHKLPSHGLLDWMNKNGHVSLLVSSPLVKSVIIPFLTTFWTEIPLIIRTLGILNILMRDHVFLCLLSVALTFEMFGCQP